MKEIKKTVGTFESYDGTRIYYEVRGEGRPLVFCYGLACLINHWSPQVKYFSESYQTIVFDYRGHHASEKPVDSSTLSFDGLAKDIKALIDHLGISKASFWGHSFGVQLLTRYHELYPETVENFVFINGYVANPIKGMFGVDFLPSVFEQFKKTYHNYPELIRMVWRNLIDNPALHPLAALAGGFNLQLTRIKDIEIYARGVAQIDLDVFIALFSSMMDYDGHGALENIKVPTLIVAGNKDGVTPIAAQVELNNRIENSQMIAVPYGSHCTQLDLPELVNLRAEKFLRENGYDKKTEKPRATPPRKRKPKSQN